MVNRRNTQKMKMISSSSSSSSYSSGLCFLKISPAIFHQNPTQPPIFNQLTPPQSHSHAPSISNHNNGSPIQTSRRKLLNISTLTIIATFNAPCKFSWAELLQLERYTDINEGFTLLRPTSWIKVEKAGATVLFEDPSKGGNNLGVVVTPVRLTTLAEFGDPEFVSNKLVQAEKRKESTKDVQIVSFVERKGENAGPQVYEFEYIIDSTRGGLKRIFSAAFVASKKLYLLNIAHSDNPQQPIDNHTRLMLEQVLHSFDHVIPPPSTSTTNL